MDLTPEDITAKPEKVRKICILGFADSRVQAPFADTSWEIWGVNDVYAHVPRTDVTFEVHPTLGLGHRRNPQHEAWLREGKQPVWMTQAHKDFPSSQGVPYDLLIQKFPRAYFTNSISIMLGMAILDIIGESTWNEKDWTRGEIAIYGVDMASGGGGQPGNEYAAQRPSCEYFVGIADGLQIPTFIPENSDLCKATGIYGLHSTAPLAAKIQSRLDHLRNAKIQVMQQQAQAQGQQQAFQSQLDQVRGQMAALEYIRGVWTLPTDAPIGAILPEKDRGLPMPGSPLSEVHTENGKVLEPVLGEGI